MFLRTINSWQLGLSDHYNTQQVVANLNWKGEGSTFSSIHPVERRQKAANLLLCSRFPWRAMHPSKFIYVSGNGFFPDICKLKLTS